jgi:alpha-glucosidase
VEASSDTTPSAAPANLTLDSTSNSDVRFSWDAGLDPDLAGYEVYRQDSAAPGYIRISRFFDPGATDYVDDSVTTGKTYEYYVVAFDTSFNRSVASNVIQATAEPRLVEVTFLVGVPAYTPGVVYISGDIPEFGPWNPGLVQMTQVDIGTWSHTIDLLDGSDLQFKFTRGSWDTVESWGSITGLNNRSLRVDYGGEGTMAVDLTATDWGNGADSSKAVRFWRDPLVVGFSPAAGATGVPLSAQVSVSWSIPMEPDTAFEVSGPGGPVAGPFAYDAESQVVTFTPDADLEPGVTYTVLVAGAVSVGVPNGDSGVQQTPVTWVFTTVT